MTRSDRFLTPAQRGRTKLLTQKTLRHIDFQIWVHGGPFWGYQKSYRLGKGLKAHVKDPPEWRRQCLVDLRLCRTGLDNRPRGFDYDDE